MDTSLLCPRCGDDNDADHHDACELSCRAVRYDERIECVSLRCELPRTEGVVCADHRPFHCWSCGVPECDSNTLLGRTTKICTDCTRDRKDDDREEV